MYKFILFILFLGIGQTLFAQEQNKNSFYFYIGSNLKYVHYYQPVSYENLLTNNLQFGLEYRLKEKLGLRYQKEFYFLPVSKLEWGSFWLSSISNEFILNYYFSNRFMGMGPSWSRKQQVGENYINNLFLKINIGSAIDFLEFKGGINVQVKNQYHENSIQPEFNIAYFFNDPRLRTRKKKPHFNMLFGWKVQNEKWFEPVPAKANNFFLKNGIRAGLELDFGDNAIFLNKEFSSYFIHKYLKFKFHDTLPTTFIQNYYFDHIEQFNMIGIYHKLDVGFARTLNLGLSYTFFTKDGVDQNFPVNHGYIQRYRYHGFSTLISLPVKTLDLELRHDFLFSGKHTSINNAKIPKLKVFDPNRISLSVIYRLGPKRNYK